MAGSKAAAAEELLQRWAAAAAALINLWGGGSSCRGKSQSGGPKKSGGGGQPTLPDSGEKVKKNKKVFPFNNLATLNLDFLKKMLNNVKKVEKQITAVTH